MKNTVKNSLLTMFLAFGMFMSSPAVMADGHANTKTILDRLLVTDGAQAVVAAVLVVDEAQVLPFSLAEILGDKNGETVLLAPSNAAFENLLGLNPGFLNGLSIDEIKAALPGLLPPGVDASAVAAILLKHVALPEKANLRTASDLALLAAGSVEVADGSSFAVGIGASGVQINYETTVIRANILSGNGVTHFIDTVILDGLL